MNRTIARVMSCCAYFSMLAVASADPIHVPIGDVPGTGAQIGSGNQGSAAGIEFLFSGFDPSQFTELYFGVNPESPFTLPRVSLNSTATNLTFAEVQGTTAIWQGSTVVNADTADPTTVPLRFLMDITGLGPEPWIDPASVSLPAGMGAAIADPLGLNFDIKVHFQADYGAGFVPLTPAPANLSGGIVGSGFGIAFYVVRPVPEPATILLAGTGLCCGAAVATRRRRKARRP